MKRPIDRSSCRVLISVCHPFEVGKFVEYRMSSPCLSESLRVGNMERLGSSPDHDDWMTKPGDIFNRARLHGKGKFRHLGVLNVGVKAHGGKRVCVAGTFRRSVTRR
jgi:hypothetical protein